MSHFVLPVLFVACMWSAGCVSWWYMGWGGPPSEADRRALPYYGTGSVNQVYIEQFTSHTNVHVIIASPYSPMVGTRLLVMRDGALVGRLLVKAQAAGSIDASVLGGTVKIGDLAIGIQHERKFKEVLPAKGASQ